LLSEAILLPVVNLFTQLIKKDYIMKID